MAKSFDNIRQLVVGELNITQDQKKSYKITMTGDTLKFLHRSNASDSFIINKDGSITLPVAMSFSPSSPASGGMVFTKSDGKLYFKNSSGTEYDLTTVAGGDGDITGVTAGTGLGGGGTSGTVTLTTNDSAIVHDNLSGFVANEHIDHSSVSISSGTGLSGGGTIASNQTLALDLASVISGDGENRILTSDADGTLTAESNLTFVDNIMSVSGKAHIGDAITNPTTSGAILTINKEDVDAADDEPIEDYSLLIARETNTTGAEVGMGFKISTQLDSDASSVGGAITFERTDSNSKGQLHFKTKGSTDAIDIDTRMTISPEGNVDVITHNGSSTGLKLGGTLVTATATELNYVDGVTSAIQTQINTLQADVDTNESDADTIMDLKAPIDSPTFTGDATFDTSTLHVDSTNHRVGIGTIGPKVPLDIYEMGGLTLGQTVIQYSGGNSPVKTLSTSLTVLGSNSKVTFTAPANEKVMIEVYFPYVYSGTGDDFHVALSSASSHSLWDSNNKYHQKVSRTLVGEPVVVKILVDSGLTAGSSTNIWISCKEESSNTDLYFGGTDAGTFGPLIIKAISVPNTYATATSL